jgi:hypothetical protein
MLALGFSLALFGFWWLVGYAIVAAFHGQRNLRQAMLVAPGVGAAATLLPIFWLNRLGLPVATFGIGLAVALVLLAAVLLARTRPALPLRRFTPFGVVLLGAFVLIGRPMLEFGFEWLSYGNDDMAFYVLAAQRVLVQGYFDPPDVGALMAGADYTYYAWYTDVQAGHRPGSQLMLAWAASVSGLAPYQAFMPTILALHLVLIGAMGGLVCRSPRRHPAALATCALLAVSPLMAYGTLAQLIAQVWGLGLIGILAAVLLRPFPTARWRRLLGFSVTPAVVASALMVVYPETAPLVAGAAGVYAGVAVLRQRGSFRPTLWVTAVSGAVALLALNVYLGPSVRYLVGILTQRSRAGNPETMLFPYFLLPSGLAQFWGWQPFGFAGRDPWMSAAILLGAALLLGAIAGILVLAWRGEPVAILCLPMLALAGRVFVLRHDFILFKLAMYLAPFVVGSLVLALFSLVRRPAYRAVLLVLLGLAGLPAHTGYVERSAGRGAAVDLMNGSPTGILREFRDRVAEAAPPRIELDTVDPALARLQAAHLVGTPTAFASRDFWRAADFADAPSATSAGEPPPAVRLRKDTLATPPDAGQTWNRFVLAPGAGRDAENLFVVAVPRWTRSPGAPCGFVGLTTGRQAIFNRRRLPADGPESFVLAPCTGVRDHLVFVHSQRGEHYHHAQDRRRISVYQLERDPLFYRGRTMAALGRHLLFEVLNPSPRVRVSMHLTRSFAGDRENWLPPAAAIGTERAAFALAGRGSARVFSPPVVPQVIGGRPYVALDLGVDGALFPDRRTGAMTLFGGDIPKDVRRVVAFGRDVSLVSEEEYGALRAPSALREFPRDLADPDAEYSGLYEDGWIAEEAYAFLRRPRARSALVVRGVVPAIGDGAFSTECVVLVEGQEVARRRLGPGDFTIEVPAVMAPERARIDLRFSRVQRLPSPDNRPVAALLRFIGFEGEGS